VFIVVVYFNIDSVWKLLDMPSCIIHATCSVLRMTTVIAKLNTLSKFLGRYSLL